MTTNSGYFRLGSNPAGLCSTPSIVAPSRLFHDTISALPTGQPRICRVMSVIAIGRATPAASIVVR
jgi:hypothetical protein